VAARLLHAPLQEKSVDTVDLEWFPPFFLSSPVVTCKNKKKTQHAVDFSFFFPCFQICISLVFFYGFHLLLLCFG
jgi:hypothetical protein